MNPDIEIYLKKVEVDDILEWLAQNFSVGDVSTLGEGIQVRLVYEGDPLTCTIIERAVKGGYTSVWFKSNHTPWKDDVTCATEAYEYFRQEVRCSTGPWTADSEDQGGWYRFTDQGRAVVNWLA